MKIREGTRVLVTAGASGIGRRIAAAFLGQGAGVHVCDVAGDRGADLLRELPGVGFTQPTWPSPAMWSESSRTWHLIWAGWMC